MTSWFCKKRPSGIHILTSDSGFINNQIGIEFLKHYIENSDAGFDANWKLMFINNHENHCTHEFMILVNNNHICSYTLIPHLIHCMQFLNVGIFQIYRHWHDVVIRKTIATSLIEYMILRFLKNFSKIRINVFKPSTIQHAFQKSNMWFINTEMCIKQFFKSSLFHRIYL